MNREVPDIARQLFHCLISRRQAKQNGYKHYFTGVPCVRGHVSKRLVSTRACIACSRENDIGRYQKNPEKEKARSRNRGRLKLPKPTRECPSVCELCHRPPKRRTLHLDHDHKTYVFRGWLCSRCNSSLGTFGDSIAGLERAINYLRRSENAA